jgi:tetratricopeptide (TPR) repeat protein
MDESLKSEKIIREYLLGRVSDETTLEGLEELLFTDEEFCSQVEIAEDSIINDYVFGHLEERDAESFRASLEENPDRRFKLELTQALREKALAEKRAEKAGAAQDAPTFFDSLKAFFRRPKYVAAFAALLVVVLVSAIYFIGRRGGSTDELAELRAIYKQERPTETRIYGFGYAPLTQTRGAAETREKNRLRRIENSLIEETEKRPDAETHHALGVFYLTQAKYADAIREFESALKLSDKNAKLHNDLGAAYFEQAKASGREQKLESLSRALEEFTTASELDAQLPEALFNRSLALQELGLARQAKESWTLYLQRDASSQWAEEARRNLSKLDSRQTYFKRDEQVLDDFLTAYRDHDDARAQRIHNDTKGTLRGIAVPLQLSRRYLLARRGGNEAEAAESLNALAYIGRLERTGHDEFFFLN